VATRWTAATALIKTLTCGGLNIGGGGSIVPEDPTPDGSTSRFALSCTGSICNIGPTSTAPPLNSTAPDCTNTGCNFGTPLPIPNPFDPSLSLCMLNTWSAPASGTLNLSSGASKMNVPLSSDVYLTRSTRMARQRGWSSRTSRRTPRSPRCPASRPRATLF
jgi:hypothetical protein